MNDGCVLWCMMNVLLLCCCVIMLELVFVLVVDWVVFFDWLLVVFVCGEMFV